MNSERELALMIKGGDHHAFKSVFDIYAARIYSYAYKFVKDKAVAEDITQEVFKKLWETRKALNENKSLSGFIFTLCYHNTINHFRQESKEAQVRTDGLLEIVAAPGDGMLEHKEMHSIYRQAVEKLPARRKEVYLLSRHEGLSNTEIASRLNISIKTVENQMSSALYFIRSFFKSNELLFILVISHFIF